VNQAEDDATRPVDAAEANDEAAQRLQATKWRAEIANLQRQAVDGEASDEDGSADTAAKTPRDFVEERRREALAENNDEGPSPDDSAP
jgi:hypothetical protein